MDILGKTAAVLCCTALAAPGGARAAQTNSHTFSGAVGATVVEPSRLQPVRDLRFGNMMSPPAAGTVVVASDGTVTTAAGMVGADTVPQPVEGRGPARFLLDGANSRFFIVQLPNRITLTSATSSMEARTFTSNTRPGRNTIDASGRFTLDVGATLQVNANQAAGSYAGTFEVSVIYQ